MSENMFQDTWLVWEFITLWEKELQRRPGETSEERGLSLSLATLEALLLSSRKIVVTSLL